MAKILFLVLVAAVGCGGSPFTAGAADEADGGPPVATGGAPMVGSGGKVGLSMGGAPDSGGAGSGGSSSGGAPSSGGAVGSTGGTSVEADAGTGGAPVAGGTTGAGGSSAVCTPGEARCLSAASIQTCDASGSWAAAVGCALFSGGNYAQCCGSADINTGYPGKTTCGLHLPSTCGK